MQRLRIQNKARQVLQTTMSSADYDPVIFIVARRLQDTLSPA